jgi:hypothetical protein
MLNAGVAFRNKIMERMVSVKKYQFMAEDSIRVIDSQPGYHHQMDDEFTKGMVIPRKITSSGTRNPPRSGNSAIGITR